MSYLFRSLSACLFGLALSPLLAAPASAVDAVAQAPCPLGHGNGTCQTFDFDDVIPTIRSFAFNMPRAGKALIRFDGTMQCVVLSPNADFDVIDLGSQIVTNEAAIPNYGGPGGNRYSMRLHHNGISDGPSSAINLAASRLVNFATGGVKTVHFKFNKFVMRPATQCLVFTAAFTVQTFP